MIRGLPSAVPAIGPGTNNGTGGGATIDLRGLGSNRTLVLLDGRRLVPFDLNGVVDTNSIPVALLQSVDVVSGGASAVYGADAVSGVVNFQLKKNFQGVEISSTYGGSERGDAKRRRTDLTIGSALADGKGNVALSIGATSTDAVTQGKRSWGEVSRSSTTGNPQGSFTTVPAYLDSAAISYQLDANGSPDLVNLETYNFNPLNYYQTPLKRIQATALGNYTINDHAEVYAELMYTRSNVISNLAPSGTFFNTYSIPIGNPFINATLRNDICTAYKIAAADCVVGSATEFSVDVGRRFVELGPRVQEFRNKTLQSTVGVRGALFGNWTYDAYMSHGEADQNQLQVNWGSNSKVQQALRSLDGVTCTDGSNGCVPLNIFGPAGTITADMAKFINLSSITTVGIKQDVHALFFSGDLGGIKSPFSKRPIGLAFGLESREVTANNFADAAGQINGEVLGTGAPSPTVEGKFKLSEVYAEAKIPVASDLPFVHALNLDLGVRSSKFKTTSSTSFSSYKFGGDWAPVKGVRVRAMGQRATRAPNVSELFTPQITSLDNLAVDPCQGAAINAADIGKAGTLTNLCVQTGVPTSRVGTLPAPSAGQVNVLTGGNPLLKPEGRHADLRCGVRACSGAGPDGVPGLLQDRHQRRRVFALGGRRAGRLLQRRAQPWLRDDLGLRQGGPRFQWHLQRHLVARHRADLVEPGHPAHVGRGPQRRVPPEVGGPGHRGLGPGAQRRGQVLVAGLAELGAARLPGLLQHGLRCAQLQAEVQPARAVEQGRLLGRLQLALCQRCDRRAGWHQLPAGVFVDPGLQLRGPVGLLASHEERAPEPEREQRFRQEAAGSGQHHRHHHHQQWQHLPAELRCGGSLLDLGRQCEVLSAAGPCGLLPMQKAGFTARLFLACGARRASRPRGAGHGAHFGAKRMAPSRRITSPLSMSFSKMCLTSLA